MSKFEIIKPESEIKMSAQSSTKRHASGVDRDRLSKLNDPVIHHILSFMKMREVGRTTLFSKRWRNVWTGVPTLNFTDKYILPNSNELSDESSDDVDESLEMWKSLGIRDKIKETVDMVLLLRESYALEKFSLRCPNCLEEEDIQRWLLYATGKNVKAVNIELTHFEYLKPCRLPEDLFACQSLEELSLTIGCNIELSAPKTISRLRRLHLDGLLDEDGILGELVSLCPVLEDLDLWGCEFRTVVNLSSNSLKCLSIDHCDMGGRENRIRTPNVVTLEYNCSWEPGTDLEGLSSLQNATVRTSERGFVSLIRSLTNAKTLKFECYFECMIKEERSKFPTFDNLRRLTLDGPYINPKTFQLVVCFLQQAPNLEMFTLNIREARSEVSLTQWKAFLESRKLCFECPQLKAVEIRASGRDEKIHELMMYMLSNATALDKISFVLDEDLLDDEEVS